MGYESIKVISKWWLRILSALTGLSLPTIAFFLRSNLETYLKSVTPEQLALIVIILLGIIGFFVALFILQRPWLTWDVSTGTWLNRFSSMRYCGTCKANKRIIVPLKNEISGWRCVACDTFRTDPKRKHLQQSRTRSVISPGIGRD